MALFPGARVGVYEIIASIGVGGMGEVYRATDTTLGRSVAIKILPDAFASDPERLARFEREAKTLASLNHPNIATIFGFEQSGGAHALVMEFVEGDDLSQRIARARSQSTLHCLSRNLKSGHLVFIRRGSLMAVPFDLKTLETVGSPVEVLKGIRTNFGDLGAFSCSNTGTCIYAPGSTNMQRTVVMVDRAGTARTVAIPAKNYAQPRLSPAGDRLLLWLEQQRCDVVVADLVRGNVSPLTSEGDNHSPAWVPGGQQISYVSGKRGARGFALFLRSVSDSNSEEPLAADVPPLLPEVPQSWAPDRTLAYSDGQDIWTVTPADGLERSQGRATGSRNLRRACRRSERRQGC